MVDHRADDDQGLRFLVNSGDDGSWDRGGILDRAREWLGGVLGGSAGTARHRNQTMHRQSHAGAGRFGLAGPVRTNRLAVALSAIWTGVLVAYAIGYFTRLGDTEGGTRVLPTLDLVFFIFAIIGPVVMIWFAVAMLNRAANLSEAITGQSESALALAATINNLNDSVDALTVGTTGRLEQACDRMEREAAASVASLDKSLTSITEKLETALLDGVILMDTSLRERTEAASRKLFEQQSGLSDAVQANVQAVRDALEAETRSTGAAQRELTTRLDGSLSETAARLDRAIKDLAAQQKVGIGAANDSMEATANRLATSFAGTLAQQIAVIDGKLNTANAELASAVSETSGTIRNDLGRSLSELRDEVETIRTGIASNPPATSEDLAALMGEAVHRIISPERSALTQSVLRITALEENAKQLLERIDRTSRLAPMLEDATDSAVEQSSDATDTLFGALPTHTGKVKLNWTAVIHVLNDQEAVPGTRDVIQKTLQDPDIANLVEMRDAILNALGDHGLFADDIVPEHTGAGLWVAWSLGERSDRTATLAGVRDDVSRAIARGWLRQSTANRILALRFMQTYQSLLERSVADIGQDGRIVELADTSSGRLFILLGGLNAIFTPRAAEPQSV